MVTGLVIGFVAGVIFCPLALRLFGVGWKKIEKNIDHLSR
jgi:hypothetical protein